MSFTPAKIKERQEKSAEREKQICHDFDPFSSSWDGTSAAFEEKEGQRGNRIVHSSIDKKAHDSFPKSSWANQMGQGFDTSPLYSPSRNSVDDEDQSSSMWKPPNFPSASTQPATIPQTKGVEGKIVVIVEEQLSVRFDDISPNPWCSVTGCIRVNAQKKQDTSFCIVISDPKSNVARFERNEETCQNVTTSFSRDDIADGQVFRIPINDLSALESPVATYTCSTRLKPMPLLLKNKVQKVGQFCRVNLRIRANPGNICPLTRLAIIMVVPPDVKGETVAMSRKAGLWNEMQRTVSWTIPCLEPGENIEIQTQFEATNDADSIVTPKFPVLLRCDDTETLYSGIELKSVMGAEKDSIPLDMNITLSSRLLYRKI